MLTCSIDLETRSAADLKKTGAYRYFEDATADVLCAAFALDDGPVLTWRRGDPPPAIWQEHVRSGGTVSAHNAAFEYWALLLILGPRYGWAVPEIAQVRDTMAQAAAMSIPQALDGAARAMGLDQEKDKNGTRLIRKFCLPRKARKGEVPGRLYWAEPEDDPEDFDQLVGYCAQDVVVERALRQILVPLSPAEQDVWVFNLVMNTRGVRIDLDLVNALQKIAEQAKDRLDREMAVATGYEITACSQVAALTRWLQAQGVPADKLNKNAIEELLADELPPAARRAVEIRKEAAKTSTAKLTSMLNYVSSGDRIRGLHLYHGAGTGRWSGKGPQFQNLTRGSGTVKDPEGAVDVMLHGDAGWVDLIYGNPMSAVSDMLRSCLVASPGHRLLAADFSSIEGRVTAWVAGDDDEIEAYKANDAGTGAGIYEIAAGGIFNTDPFNVSKQQRQVGKAACVAEGTLVIVRDEGGHITAKPIQYVKITDLAWDGEEWVSHSGVVCNGEQECVQLSGMKLTPDHLIWCGAQNGWTEAARVASSANTRLLASVIAKACWPSPATWRRLAVESTLSWCAAIAADRSIASRSTTSILGASSGATPARKNPAPGLGRSYTSTTPRSAQTPSIGDACSIASQQSVLAAMCRVLDNGPRMAVEESAAGGSINTATNGTETKAGRGGFGRLAGDMRCSSIWSRFRAGTIQIWNLIASTTTRATNPGTCDLQTGEPTRATSAKSTRYPTESSNSKKRLRVYDLVNSGPRNRFTIFSADGPLIVHNCLALGFGGGVLAFNSMARIYGIDMAPVFPILREAAAPEVFERATERYEECAERQDTGTDLMTREAWIASEITKVQWRARHPSTVALWSGLEDAARDAVMHPGSIATYGRIAYIVRRGFLWCRLPSGRCLAYGAPKVEDRKTPWGATKPSVTALGVNSQTKKWERFALYGGLATENVVQAIARDLMAHGMLMAEAAGYPIVMTVHDEAVADTPAGHGTLAEFERLLCDSPAWATGLPVVASGYESTRYRKD